MTAVVIGIVFIAIGGLGMLHWSQDFLAMVRGFGPFSMFIGGLVSLIAGIGSTKKKNTDDGGKS